MPTATSLIPATAPLQPLYPASLSSDARTQQRSQNFRLLHLHHLPELRGLSQVVKKYLVFVC